MPLISGRGVTKSYGDRDVLANISFGLEAGDRIGLVGRNGQGKTTLLRILARLDEPTTGVVEARRDLRVAYLPQEPPTLGGVSLWDAMLAVFADLRGLAERMDELAGQLADHPDDGDLLEQFGKFQHEFESRGGYAYEVRIKTVLTGLGFGPADYTHPLERFSGGQRTRVALAKMLLAEPDVLLLDEPTNHLDLEATEWLERYLAGVPHALMIVSHDRYFLDKITARTWEVAFGGLETYRGNYSAYLTQREHRFAERKKVWAAQQEHIRKTEEFIRRHHAASRSKEARGRKTRLERFIADEAVDRPAEHKQVRMKLDPQRRSGEMIFKVSGLVAGYEPHRPVVSLPEMRVERGDRVAVIGGNGTGKTTLLRTLLGELPALDGTVTCGSGMTFGYLPQMQPADESDRTVLQTVLEAGGDRMPVERARTLLGSFLFQGDDVLKPIANLSGGERSRVMLARLAAGAANVLMLDEPTNHLDIPATEALQQVLAGFPGTVLFVTHDRYLIDHLATQIWAIDSGRVHVIRPAGPRDDAGPWQDYLAWRAARGQSDQPPGPRAAPAKGRDDTDRRRKREVQRARRRQERLEDEIHALESYLEKVSQQISDASVGEDLDAVHRLAADYKESDEKLKALWQEWTHVTESLEP